MNTSFYKKEIKKETASIKAYKGLKLLSNMVIKRGIHLVKVKKNLNCNG